MNLNLDRSTWKRVALGDVVRNRNDYFDSGRDGELPFVAGPHIDPGQVTVSRFGMTSDDDFPPTFKRLFQAGDVLLHSRGIEKVAVVDRRGVTGEKLFVLRTMDPRMLDQGFLPWLLASGTSSRYIRANFSGSVNKFLNWRPLAAMPIELPPLDEQKRLASLLWAIETYHLAHGERSKSRHALLEVRLRTAWLEETKRPIGMIADCVTGTTPSKANASFWSSEDVPFYTPSEIIGESMETARQMVSYAGAQVGRMLPANAVAVACIGGDMGKSAVISAPGISNQQITSVVGLSEDDAYLLRALLAHPVGRAAMEARETTTVVRKLNKSDLMKVEVPWPNDRSTLWCAVRADREAMKAETEELTRLDRVRSSLLTEIFGD